MNEDDRKVTVCSACLRASCWLGILLCEGYRGASTVTKTVRELREVDREHPDYWRPGATDFHLDGSVCCE